MVNDTFTGVFGVCDKACNGWEGCRMTSGQSSGAFHAKYSPFQQTHCRAPMEKRLGDTQQR